MNTGSDEAKVAEAVDEVAEQVKAEKPFGSKAPEFIKARRTLHLSWQVGVFIVGLAVVVAGIIMLPLPGPGWVVIFGGMAIWATEFGAPMGTAHQAVTAATARPNGDIPTGRIGPPTIEASDSSKACSIRLRSDSSISNRRWSSAISSQTPRSTAKRA